MSKDILFICDRCNAMVEKGHTRYVLELKMYAGTDPIEVESERMDEIDFDKEIHRLIESMQKMDEIYLHDQVYMQRRYFLCPSCREKMYREVFWDRRNTKSES
jgi:hypothetical protein